MIVSFTMSGDLSPQQKEALENLRAVVEDIPDLADKDDYYFLRWLRARRFDVRKAEGMMRKHIATRKKYGVDTILTDYTPPEVLQKCFPGGFFGESREGLPVWYDNFGNLDIRGLHRSVTEEDLLKLKCYHGEQCVQLCEQLSVQRGYHIETITMVLDFQNLSIRKHYYWPGIHMVRKILAMFEANYPERIRHVFIIKAPPIFPLGWNLVKHWIDDQTRKKISVLGSNWQEVLLEHISPDQLPQAYGGARCEPDPYCTDYINPGCDVPEKYYLTNNTETSREEMERVVVGRGSSHEVEYCVKHAGTVLRWEFVSDSHDIAFGWYLKLDDITSEVVPMRRKDSHIIPENGSHTCDTSGRYVLKFDNSYSWIRSKEVYYSVKVLLPSELHGTHETPPSQTVDNDGSIIKEKEQQEGEEEEEEDEEEEEEIKKKQPD